MLDAVIRYRIHISGLEGEQLNPQRLAHSRGVGADGSVCADEGSETSGWFSCAVMF